MLHAFVSAGAARPARRLLGGLSASVGAHAVIVGVALAGAASVAPDRPAAAPGVEHVRFTTLAPSFARRTVGATVADRRLRRGISRSRGALRHAARGAHTRTPHCDGVACVELVDLAIPIADVQVDVQLPHDATIDLVARATEGIAFERGALEQFRGMPAPVVSLRDGAYAEASVEHVAAPYGPNPPPRYPAELLVERVEDSFDVQFVVDSTGRVNRRTLEFPASVHPLFARSVRDALARSHFLPAQLAGRRVAQRVLQRFTFVLARR